MTVVYNLAVQHQNHGGETHIVVGRSTVRDYPVGTCLDAAFSGASLTRRQRLEDAAMAVCGLARPNVTASYRLALEVLGPDIDTPIMVHNAPAAMAMFREHCPHAPLWLYAHNHLFSSYTDRELRSCVDQVDGIIFVSEFLARQVRPRLKRCTGKLHVVHNGVDIAQFKPEAAPVADVPTILFVGRVLPEKGPELLIRAALKLVGSKRRFKLRIVGSSGFSPTPLTGYETRLRTLAASVPGVIEFQPYVDRAQIVREYAQAHIVCVPSVFHDPCPLVVLEAMSCGLPVVTTRRGGIPEIGTDAVMYAEQPAVGELADRLLFLLDHPEVWGDYAQRARRQAERLDWSSQYEVLSGKVSGRVQHEVHPNT